MATVVSLSGEWRGRPDPERVGEKKRWFAREYAVSVYDGWERVEVPGCWNADPRYERYEGAFWYATDFELPDRKEHETEAFVRFLAVNYFCRVWLNGRRLGEHEGGYLPFEFAVPSTFLNDSNRLVVEVENTRSPRRIPGELFDWFNYGGIVRDVELHFRSHRRFNSVKVMTMLKPSGGALVSVDYRQTGAFPFEWEISDEAGVVASGRADSGAAAGARLAAGVIETQLADAKPWHPDRPHLYILHLQPGEEADVYSVRFGIREIRVEGKRILLNDEPIKLRGVSLHEELVPYGRSIPREERFRDVREIKKLGFNALRTAHYTHDEALVEAADEVGLLVLEEIPVYWDLDYAHKPLYELAAGMVRDMIERDFNHPSVILWSVGNEVPVEDPACDRLIRGLMAEARRLDPTRIVTYVSCRFLIDKTRNASDVCCINCYIGWYYGSERDLAGLMELTRATAPDKPWIMTEFGAGAKAGFRGRRGRGKFSEEGQADFISHYIRTLNGLDWVSGWFIWIYRDFRSPIRTNRYQKGFNRKGIVSESNEPKLVCSMLPGLAEEKTKRKRAGFIRMKTAALKRLERFGYMAVQPLIARSQRSQYESFYKGTVDDS
ncbi:MAG: glycoside hydrolase family 2 TIM barrel-domain containing protein [bacterium]